MRKETVKTISNLFEGNVVRSVWDSEKEDYYFSVIDVIKVLTNSAIPRRYWTDLKKKLVEEGSQLYDNIVQLKLKSSKDGKMYKTDTLDTKGIFRLIESVPSPKAEPFKLWLANLGKEKIDEVFDPSKGINQMIDFYLKKGYDLEWIERRIKAILNRKKLTKTWYEHGIKKETEYGVLTNTIYKAWSNMTAREYKDFKNIRKESLRDNMTELEVLLTDIGELTTKELVKEYKPNNLKENINLAKVGGSIANNTKKDIENKLNKNIITNKNNLNYEYLKDSDKISKK